jgi:hypothetical protein
VYFVVEDNQTICLVSISQRDLKTNELIVISGVGTARMFGGTELPMYEYETTREGKRAVALSNDPAPVQSTLEAGESGCLARRDSLHLRGGILCPQISPLCLNY